MSAAIVVRDELGERFYDERDFPLSIGRGTGSDIHLPGRGVEETIAFLGLHEGAPFVQAAATGIPVFCNERPIEGSQWLNSGDTLRIEAARIACNLSEARLEFRVADASPEVGDAPLIVVPPPVARRELEQAPDAASEIAVPQRLTERPSAAAWALFVAAALLLGLGWFLLTAKAVELMVEPEPDRVAVEGALLPFDLGGRYLLRPGPYTVVANKAGYYTARLEIEVGSESAQSFSLRLERLPGLLTVASGDVEGASVSVDGVLLGQTPLVDAELSSGSHAVLIESRRHLPHALEVAIEGGGVRQRIDVELTPAWSPFAFVSDPPGAQLSVDGELLGTAPLTAELGAGERVVELALQGYETWRARLLVQADQPLERREVLLAPADASLLLRSNPSGASVTVDGRFRGQTPVRLSLEPDEPHKIELFKLGHDSARRSLSFEAGEERSVDVRLVVQTGQLDLVSEPADAELFVDGVSRGSANQQLELSAVPHVIEVRKPGYQTFQTTVTLHPGLPERLQVSLSTLAEAETNELLPRIRTSLGQELLLVQPGSFEMGAARREQGRRSNEVQRDVVLTRPFYIAVTEVSNADFRRFAPKHSSGLFERYSLDENDQPVVRVSWADAARYCNWLSAQDSLPEAYVESNGKPTLVEPPTLGYRLPTEAEWVWAARYAGGISETRYPWGESLPPTSLSGNYADASARGSLPNVLTGYRDDFPVSAPLASFKQNALGLYDVGGNVAEWVNDYYAVSLGSTGLESDPLGPSAGRFHVVRGSSWQDSSITELRLAYRDYSNDARSDVGFRIARYAR